jgi:hypothetical protein
MKSTHRATIPTSPRAARLLRAQVLALLALTAVACGDYGGAASTGGETSGPTTVFDPTNIPGSREAFEQTVYPLLTQYCAQCHAGGGEGSPSFSHPVVGTAYNELLGQSKVNLAEPDRSRIVRKLADETHNCWTNDCTADAMAMQAAVQAWADQIEFDEGGVSIGESLSSATLMLADGTEDTSALRYDEDIIARWEFKEGAGAVAFDTSGVAPAMDLALSQDVEWMTAWGINIETGIARAMGTSSRKLYDRIAAAETGTGQYSVEAWVTNATVTLEGPARILTYSANPGASNFTLGQTLYNYDYRNRSISENIGGNGAPALVTYDADQDLQDTLQHVVITYDLIRGRRIHVDGRWTDDVDEQMAGRLFNWSPNYAFALGNEITLDRQWRGQVRFVAIYDHALTEAQIRQNYDAGVGKRLSMSFDVSRWTGPGSAIEFQVSEFDDASYMFCNPTFRTSNPANYRLAHVRIAVNGTIAPTGQGFVTLDTLISEPRQELTARCAVIPKVTGPLTDQFTIVFEHLGGFQNIIDEPDPPPVVVMLDPSARPNHGIRDYARIRESMADITNVDPLLPAIDAVFAELEQQLPSEYDVRSFVSSHQVGIAKLALEFCDALVESTTLRQQFFGTFPFTTEPVAVFGAPGTPNATNRNQIADALYDRTLGTGLVAQPSRNDTRADLSSLVDGLVTQCVSTPCNAERTRTIVKSECTAVLASAAMSMH